MDRALLVGINSYRAAPLRGCVNDISDMAEHIVEYHGFAKSSVRLLADDRATTEEIINHLNWLVDNAQTGDRIFFHYSGHGAQMATRDHQGEIDGLDEVICPVDFNWTDKYVIRDKDFRRIFGSIPKGVDFIWVSDSCHSGDLSKDFPPQDTLWRMFPVPIDIQWRNETALELQNNALTLMSSITDMTGNVALISGCESNQTSADAVFDGRSNGALTYFLLKSLSEDGGRALALDMLVKKVQEKLAATNKYRQIPGVEGSPDIIKKPFFTI